MRWARSDDDLSLNNPRFADQIATLAARIHGRDKDELIGESVRQQRRFMFASVSSIVTLIVATAVAGYGWREAMRQTTVARSETERARRTLAATYFREGSLRVSRGAPTEALPFFGAAIRLDHGNSATRAATLDALALATRSPVSFQHDALIRAAAFGPDGTHLVTASEDGTAQLWDARTGRSDWRAASASSDCLVRSIQRRWHARGHGFGGQDGARVGRADGPPPRRRLQHGRGVRPRLFSPDGTRVVTASEDRTARVWDARTGQPVGAPLQHRLSSHVGGVQPRRHARGDRVRGQDGAGVGRADRASRWARRCSTTAVSSRRRSAPTARAW